MPYGSHATTAELGHVALGEHSHGFTGTRIPLSARIFAVIDVWDALVSDRPYRKTWAKEDAVAYIEDNAGKLFDPEVVRVFSANVHQFLHQYGKADGEVK